MPPPERTAPGHPPLVALSRHPDWRALKDAFYSLLVARAVEREETTFGDALDGVFLARLVASGRIPHGGASAEEGSSSKAVLEAALQDLGSDMGRHILAKRIDEDHLPTALRTLDALLEAMGAGRLETTHVFHREAETRFRPAEGLAAADPALLSAWLSGALEGALEEVFNCKAYIRAGPEHLFDVRLGGGRHASSDIPRTAAPTDPPDEGPAVDHDP